MSAFPSGELDTLNRSDEPLIGANSTAPKLQLDLEDAVVIEAAPEDEAKTKSLPDIPRDETRLQKAGFRLPLPESEVQSSDDAVVVEAASEAEAKGKPLADIPRDESKLQKAGFRLPLPDTEAEIEAEAKGQGETKVSAVVGRSAKDNAGFLITGFNQSAVVARTAEEEERGRSEDKEAVAAITPVVVIDAAISVDAEKRPSQAVASTVASEPSASGLQLASSIHVVEEEAAVAADKKPVEAEEKLIVAGEKAEETEAKALEAEEKPGEVQAKPVETEEKPAVTENKPVEAEKNLVKEEEEKPVEAEEKNVKTENKLEEAEGKPSEAVKKLEAEKDREGRKIIDLAEDELGEELDNVQKGEYKAKRGCLSIICTLESSGTAKIVAHTA